MQFDGVLDAWKPAISGIDCGSNGRWAKMGLNIRRRYFYFRYSGVSTTYLDISVVEAITRDLVDRFLFRPLFGRHSCVNGDPTKKSDHDEDVLPCVVPPRRISLAFIVFLLLVVGPDLPWHP